MGSRTWTAALDKRLMDRDSSGPTDVFEQSSDGAALARQMSPDRRRRLGVYLTPAPLAELMAEWVVGERPTGHYIDPAAGTGRLLEALARSIARLGPRQLELPGLGEGSVVSHLYGVEIDPELARWTNDRLAARLGPAGRSICRVADALTLLRQKPRQGVLERPFFDGVVANPPYVREKNQKRLFRRILEREPAWSQHFQPRQDLQQLFLVLGLSMLAPGGHLVYLMNPYWLQSDGGQALRRWVLERAYLRSLVDFGELRLFPEAAQHSLLVHLVDRRGSAVVDVPGKTLFVRVTGMPDGGPNRVCADLRRIRCGDEPPPYLQASWGDGPRQHGRRGRWYLPTPRDAELARMAATGVTLGDLFETHQGVVSGADRVTARHRQWLDSSIPLGAGVYVLHRRELAGLGELSQAEQQLVRPVYRARHIGRLVVRPGEHYILYMYRGVDPASCPNLLRHLSRFRALLERKRECRLGLIPWYELHWPRSRELFQRPRVVTPRRSTEPRFAMAWAGYCEQSDVALVTSPSNDPRQLLGLAVLLNSAPIRLWCRHRGKHKGRVREYFGRALEEIPLPRAAADDPSALDSLADLAGQWDDADRAAARLFSLDPTVFVTPAPSQET